jgi:hypothetical protein
MKEQHLTAEQIQLYASGIGENDAAVAAHISECGDCRREVADYLLLFTELKNAPKPAFAFDVVALVMPRLPAVAPEPVTERYNHYLVPVVAVCVVLVPAFVFRLYFVNLIKAVPAAFIYPILAIPVLVIILRCVKMYREYLHKINALNIY